MTSSGAAAATSSRGRRAPTPLVACAALVALAAVVPIAYLALRALSADAAAARSDTARVHSRSRLGHGAPRSRGRRSGAPRRRPVRMARRAHRPPGTARLGHRGIASARYPELRRRARAPRSARAARAPPGGARAARRRTASGADGILGGARRPDPCDVSRTSTSSPRQGCEASIRRPRKLHAASARAPWRCSGA